jgi:hypothetical protein
VVLQFEGGREREVEEKEKGNEHEAAPGEDIEEDQALSSPTAASISE